jgi:uncharacterized protein (DUF2147 family)
MKIIIFSFFLLLTAFKMNAQITGDEIKGTWQTVAKNAQLTIYKEGQFFIGKINWLKKPGKDVNNPDPAMRSRDLVGAVILKGFIFNGNNKWEDGKIYDPSGGKTYSCNMKLKNNNTLEIRGYIGISIIGKTEVWTRTF